MDSKKSALTTSKIYIPSPRVLFLAVFMCLSVLLSSVSLASSPTRTIYVWSGATEGSPLTEEVVFQYNLGSFSGAFAYAFRVLLPIGIAIGVVAIIIAGYTYMTSQSEPQKLKDANEKLAAALIGILFIMLSIFLLRVIITTLIAPNVTF